jgi:hypothetical protein
VPVSAAGTASLQAPRLRGGKARVNPPCDALHVLGTHASRGPSGATITVRSRGPCSAPPQGRPPSGSAAALTGPVRPSLPSIRRPGAPRCKGAFGGPTGAKLSDCWDDRFHASASLGPTMPLATTRWPAACGWPPTVSAIAIAIPQSVARSLPRSGRPRAGDRFATNACAGASTTGRSESPTSGCATRAPIRLSDRRACVGKRRILRALSSAPLSASCALPTARRDRPGRGCRCPIPAARAPAATLLLSCLQDSVAWLAPGASTSGVKRVRAPCALWAQWAIHLSQVARVGLAPAAPRRPPRERVRAVQSTLRGDEQRAGPDNAPHSALLRSKTQHGGRCAT